MQRRASALLALLCAAPAMAQAMSVNPFENRSWGIEPLGLICVSSAAAVPVEARLTITAANGTTQVATLAVPAGQRACRNGAFARVDVEVMQGGQRACIMAAQPGPAVALRVAPAAGGGLSCAPG